MLSKKLNMKGYFDSLTMYWSEIKSSLNLVS